MAEAKWPRARDAWEALTWIVSRDPQEGKAVTESGRTRAITIEGARSIGFPTLTLVYEIQNPKIIIHDALFTDAKYAEAGNG